ncbi:MAG: MaoC family dehydratase [Thermodesulfovibrionales bacterium]|nr:MaoC family dehydratase [Thermodesulfovibrionales bacterium]
MREISSYEELTSLVGQEIGISDWFEITQDRIDLFAEVSMDHQWIHVDSQRAKDESPFGNTVAHGFLTLSLLSFLESQVLRLKIPYKMRINYGLNRVRFPSPVIVGSKIRAKIKLQNIEETSKGVLLTLHFNIERQGSSTPCCIAEWLLLYYQ